MAALKPLYTAATFILLLLLLFLFSGKGSFLIRYRCFKGIPEARENSEQYGISFTLYFHGSSCSRPRTTDILEVSGQQTLCKAMVITALDLHNFVRGRRVYTTGESFYQGSLYQRNGAHNMLVSEGC